MGFVLGFGWHLGTLDEFWCIYGTIQEDSRQMARREVCTVKHFERFIARSVIKFFLIERSGMRNMGTEEVQ